MNLAAKRLVVISNRLPVALEQHGDERRIVPGAGGLATALAPILRDRGGLWIGWPGTVDGDQADLDALLAEGTRRSGYCLQPVLLTPEERDRFYYGFSNEIVWPLFHDLQTCCNFDPAYWVSYLAVNRKYAQVVEQHARPDDFVWVHDYHLMNVGHELRGMGVAAPLAFFQHIPFPPLDIFVKLPWRLQLLRALLEYDLVGFQTARDRGNFVECVRRLLRDVQISRHGEDYRVQTGLREVRIGSFPISIDFNEFAQQAASTAVTEMVRRLRSDFEHRQIVLGLDRLDYTKGIPSRLIAFRHALAHYPDLHRQVSLVQIVIPSREDIPMYQNLKAEIEGLVGQINGQFTQPGWVPVHYVYRSLERSELTAWYRAADVGLITPLKDGMNLVAKEYCACQLDDNGVLILSEFAGAAAELKRGALLVNPNDREGVAEAIYRAVNKPPAKRRPRMRRLRRTIRKHDIYAWLEAFLRAGADDEFDALSPLRNPGTAVVL